MEALRWEKGRCTEVEGDGELFNLSAESRFGAVNLGEGDLDLSCVGGYPALSVFQKSPELESQLRLKLVGGQMLQIQGTLTPKSGLNESVKKGLAYMAKPRCKRALSSVMARRNLKHGFHKV